MNDKTNEERKTIRPTHQYLSKKMNDNVAPIKEEIASDQFNDLTNSFLFHICSLSHFA